jgi:hypothetical protein
MSDTINVHKSSCQVVDILLYFFENFRISKNNHILNFKKNLSVGAELVRENTETYTNGRIDIAKPIVFFAYLCMRLLTSGGCQPNKNVLTPYVANILRISKKCGFHEYIAQITFLASFIQLLRNSLIFDQILKMFRFFMCV